MTRLFSDDVKEIALRLAVVVAMVLASFPTVGVQTAKAADHPSIHVWLSGGAMIEFFNFTTGEQVDVSVVGVGPVGSIEAESDRFVAEFDFEFDGNQTVVAEQGARRAEVVLVDMSIDFDGVEVFGTGPDNTTLFVEVVGSECPYGDHSTTDVTTDEFGEWATNFGDFGGECADGLGEEFQGSIFHFDAEGDATIVENGNEGVDAEEVKSGRTLTEDHEGGFVIVEDHVTLDCDGHRIYAGREDGVVIEGRTGVTVKNCVIEGFRHRNSSLGVHTATPSRTTLRHSQWSSGHGITLFFSDDKHAHRQTQCSPRTRLTDSCWWTRTTTHSLRTQQ